MFNSTRTTINQHLLELANLEPTGFPFISLYLNAQADQHGRDNFQTFVRKEFKNRAKTYPAGSPERESFIHDTKRIIDFLQSKLPASANGVAIFACYGADAYFKTIEFEAPIDSNELYVASQPNLFPLARIAHQYPRCAALIADTEAARLIVFDLGQTVLRTEVDNTGRDLAAAGVWSQLRYERRVEEYNALHAREVVEMLDQTVREEDVQHIILGGDEVIIPLIRKELPLQLAELVVDVLPLDIRTPEHEVLKATMDALRHDDMHSDAEKVSEMLDKYRAGQLAVAGVEETVRALSRGQVDEVLLCATPKDILVDEATLRELFPLSLPDGDERLDGSESGWPEVAGELVTRAVLTRASVTFIEDAALLSEVGGVGALLRFRVRWGRRA